MEYSKYLKVCDRAAKDSGTFANFKSNLAYRTVVEACSKLHGSLYLDWIKKNSSFILNDIDTFVTSDDVGNPFTYQYDGLDVKIAATTLRYIKTLAELINLFGTLEDKDIIEIGGGYGGQCKIIYDYVKPRSYTLVDLPTALPLAKRYLKRFGIKDVAFKTPDDVFENIYSLCISNYAFSEFERDYQNLYIDKIINKSIRGYMLCNCLSRNKGVRMTILEVLGLKKNGMFVQEDPLTSKGNALYLWGTKLDIR